MMLEHLLIGLKVLLTCIFAFAIYVKLFGKLKAKFARWGYKNWFLYTLSALEILGIAGLYSEPYQALSIMLLVTIMVGAIFTLLRGQEQGRAFILPLISLILLVSIWIIQFT